MTKFTFVVIETVRSIHTVTVDDEEARLLGRSIYSHARALVRGGVADEREVDSRDIQIYTCKKVEEV